MDKRKMAILVALVGVLLLAAGRSQARPATAVPRAKQLAGPAEEFLSGRMRLPDPAHVGERSKAAVLPVRLTPAAEGGWAWQGDFLVDEGESLLLSVLPAADADWQIAVRPPGQAYQVLSGAVPPAGASHVESGLGLGTKPLAAEAYTIENPLPGRWEVRVTAGRRPPAAHHSSLVTHHPSRPDGYLAVSTGSPYRLFSHLNSYELVVGRPVGLATYAYNQRQAPDGRRAPTPLVEGLTAATLVLSGPDGRQTTRPMVDDGQHADGAAGDGVWGMTVTVTEAGLYQAQVVAYGRTAEGQPFQRTTQHLLPVVEPGPGLVEGAAVAQAEDDYRLRIGLPVEALADDVDTVQVFAEVWGRDGNGEMAPAAWIGGMVTPAYQGSDLVLPLHLDTRWLALAGVERPLELRNVRLQDRQTHIPISQQAAVPVQVDQMPRLAGEPVAAVTDEMRMGPRSHPVPSVPSVPPSSAGAVVMLVHGYCSYLVWPTQYYTDYAVFSDTFQARSHDEFAQLILEQGAAYDSYGIVAHSQGGAAALHLYSYYESGLDDASGPRLIQSLGTPYQGTSLAVFSWLACGEVWDLTYDGAALWLAGIPTWAREEVYYRTTSDTNYWWWWDYCLIVTAPFLEDPEDGVVERWAGQLESGHNLGHNFGFCHAILMRDPAQYNSPRINQDFNANAAR
ncbi:MAG: choice-of-anchor X domain-containing protein [Chloroflexota bacterium]